LTVTVKASVQNSQQDSPRYYFPCPLSQHIANATKLPVDCRCHVNIVGLDFPECKADIADGLSMQIGVGPRARTHNFGGFYSGFAEPATSELIAVMSWKDEKTKWPENDITIDVGAVMGINFETRERRIIGGRYEDPATGIQEKGTGPVLSYPFQVQKGPDGKYYVASYGYVRIDASLVPTVDIIRMDPATGNREYAWRSNHLGYNLDNQPNPYGHCGNGRPSASRALTCSTSPGSASRNASSGTRCSMRCPAAHARSGIAAPATGATLMTFTEALCVNARPMASASPIQASASARLSVANCSTPQPSQWSPA